MLGSKPICEIGEQSIYFQSSFIIFANVAIVHINDPIENNESE